MPRMRNQTLVDLPYVTYIRYLAYSKISPPHLTHPMGCQDLGFVCAFVFAALLSPFVSSVNSVLVLAKFSNSCSLCCF